MKNSQWVRYARVVLIFLLPIISAPGQSIRFAFEGDSLTLPFVRDSLRGISGLEIVPATGEWHLVSDRGWHFTFTNLKTVRDLGDSTHLKRVKKTPFWFEAIRYHSQTGTYFWTDEHEFNTSLLTGKAVRDTASQLLLKMPLPGPNKGLEGIAITPLGVLWVAPEAGWEGQTRLQQDTISFFRYADPLAADSTVERVAYPIDRCAFAQGDERLGGISEILAIDETRLLVLERCYDAAKKQLITRLYAATLNEQTHTFTKEIAFDFNRQFPGTICNLEAMAWTDTTRQTLVLMADDNFKRSSTLRNQVIVLKRR